MEVPSGKLRQEFEDVTELNSFSYPPITSDSKVVPVIDINPKHSRELNLYLQYDQTTSAASVTVHTAASSAQDTYITNLTLSVIKNATCDSATSKIFIGVVPFGRATAIQLATITTLTLTAQNVVVSVNLLYPLRVEPGSLITMQSPTYTAGLTAASCAIQGFRIPRH